MLHIRTVRTKGNSQSVQVYRYERGKRVILKHIGSSVNQDGIDGLREIAKEYIQDLTRQVSLFENKPVEYEGLLLKQFRYIGIYHTFTYDILKVLIQKIGYSLSINKMLSDLVIMRIVEPTSKLRSIELLEQYFGKKHRRQSYYESAPKWLELKEKIEKDTILFSKGEYQQDFSLLFYDVTTLYFETFESDELRKPGFSKDNKSQQPQILVALMVAPNGFPVSYEVFPGNTFEGHTIIPVLKSFLKRHGIGKFTVVADAAMISDSNVEALRTEGINYIVGARLGNISSALLRDIAHLPKTDGATIRLRTTKGYLVCSFSSIRYRKDRYEMAKQLQKAEFLLDQPGKIKRVKFLKTDSQKASLNRELISKTEQLLGIKGYYTDLPENEADNKIIIDRYHDLYKIEQAFRISKNDLKTRPIFHFKEEPIKLHLLISFMALAVSKHIELKSGKSINAFLKETKKVTDARLFNTTLKKEIHLRAEIPSTLKDLLIKIIGPH